MAFASRGLLDPEVSESIFFLLSKKNTLSKYNLIICWSWVLISLGFFLMHDHSFMIAHKNFSVVCCIMKLEELAVVLSKCSVLSRSPCWFFSIRKSGLKYW